LHFYFLKKLIVAGHWWLTSAIIDTQETQDQEDGGSKPVPGK
jgi:hypothetical protein